jgi:hypothetical protein
VQLNAICQIKKGKKRKETQPKETVITRQQTIMDENSSTGCQATLDATPQTPYFPRISPSLRTLKKTSPTSPTSPTFSGARLTDDRDSTRPSANKSRTRRRLYSTTIPEARNNSEPQHNFGNPQIRHIMNGNLDQEHRYTATTISIDDNSGRGDIEELNPNEFTDFTTSINSTITTFQLPSLLHATSTTCTTCTTRTDWLSGQVEDYGQGIEGGYRLLAELKKQERKKSIIPSKS